MKIVARMALVAALVFPAAASDVVVHRETHTDAYSTSVKTNPATVSEEVLWIGEDRMRVEEGNRVIIVRADLKKMYVLDMQAKTKTTIDLPVDLKKYVRPEEAPMIEKLVARMKPTVTPTGEIRKIGDWNATRWTVTMTMPTMSSSGGSPTGSVTTETAAGGGTTQEIWVTKDIVGHDGWQEMYASSMSTNPLMAAVATEMKAIDGLPVLVETTRKIGATEIKSREVVTSVEQKEPAEGFYEVPAGFTEKRFEPMGDKDMGLPGARASGDANGK